MCNFFHQDLTMATPECAGFYESSALAVKNPLVVQLLVLRVLVCIYHSLHSKRYTSMRVHYVRAT